MRNIPRTSRFCECYGQPPPKRFESGSCGVPPQGSLVCLEPPAAGDANQPSRPTLNTFPGRLATGIRPGGKGLSGPVSGGKGLSGPVWGGKGLSGPVWGGKGLSGPVGGGKGLSGPVSGGKGLSGPVWGGKGQKGLPAVFPHRDHWFAWNPRPPETQTNPAGPLSTRFRAGWRQGSGRAQRGMFLGTPPVPAGFANITASHPRNVLRVVPAAFPHRDHWFAWNPRPPETQTNPAGPLPTRFRAGWRQGSGRAQRGMFLARSGRRSASGIKC